MTTDLQNNLPALNEHWDMTIEPQRSLLYSFIFMQVPVILGSIIFNRVKQTFLDTV